MKRYLLFRHAEPENQAPGFSLSVVRDADGRADYPLSPRGREQALRILEATRAFGAQLIVSSSLHRARETADIVARVLELPRRDDPDLDEVNPGRRSLRVSLEDRRLAIASLLLSTAYLVDKKTSSQRSGETAVELVARIDRVFARLAKLPESRIALVGHGYWIFTAAMLIRPRALRSFWRKRTIAHGDSILIELTT